MSVGFATVKPGARSFALKAARDGPHAAASTFGEHSAHSRNIISGTPEIQWSEWDKRPAFVPRARDYGEAGIDGQTERREHMSQFQWS